MYFLFLKSFLALSRNSAINLFKIRTHPARTRIRAIDKSKIRVTCTCNGAINELKTYKFENINNSKPSLNFSKLPQKLGFYTKTRSRKFCDSTYRHPARTSNRAIT